MLSSLQSFRLRLLSLLALAAALSLVWQFRSHIPPAGLSLRNSRITQSIEELRPGPALSAIDAESLLTNGVIAFVSIRAPVGLTQTVIFEWWHRGERLDRIEESIQGAAQSGWRTFSRKVNIPQDPRGRWRVDVLTPQGQLICRLRFNVR